jgi:hypothetical protein
VSSRTPSLRSFRSAALAVVAAVILAGAIAPRGQAQAPARTGAPILVVTSSADHFGLYYEDILHAEGLPEYDRIDVSSLAPEVLSRYTTVVLAQSAPNADAVRALTSWVQGGGNLIAMRPDDALAPLLGLGTRTGTLRDGYMTIADVTSGPGRGITGTSMQFHGDADRWTTAGATVLASLSAGAETALAEPAVTLRTVGAGQAAAFTYDLARSVVYTRQGNPDWVDAERDNAAPQALRSDDLFFPDWVDFSRIQIPQADEQQRLLANLLTTTAADRVPLPRFWYLPRDLKAVVVMTGDHHGGGNTGTSARFDAMLADSPSAGCSMANWTCRRMTAYIYPGTPWTDLKAQGFQLDDLAAYQAQGFEISVHQNVGTCPASTVFTDLSWRSQWRSQRGDLVDRMHLAEPRTTRTHCVAWSGWAIQPAVEAAVGVGLDTNYYYWPAAWVSNRPGLFTGSGLPMRFADADGTPIDVYQAATQLNDEAGMDLSLHTRTLLDNALGPKGYYGAFTANIHTDGDSNLANAAAVIAAAKARDVPVITAVQLLNWLNARNASAFTGLSYGQGLMSFTIAPGAGATGLRALLPVDGPEGKLLELTRGGVSVPYTIEEIKGIEYARFDAAAGPYVARYPYTEPSHPISPAGVPSAPPLAPSPASPVRSAARPPVLKVGPARVRASRKGEATLRITCTGCAPAVRWRVRLLIGKRQAATRTVSLGRTGKRSVKLELSASARRTLARKRRLTSTVKVSGRQDGKVVGISAKIRILAAPGV